MENWNKTEPFSNPQDKSANVYNRKGEKKRTGKDNGTERRC